MNGRYLLDTNIIIALFANEVSVVSNLDQAEEVFVPSIALGELHYGAKNQGDRRKTWNESRSLLLITR